MDLATAQFLVGTEGEAALTQASTFDDPGSLAAATALRRDFPADVAAAALEQVALRRRGRSKLGERADGLFLTRAGLEQATRPRVAQFRAAEMGDAGVSSVIDLTCGLGLDALAMADAGLEVRAVEWDPVTATFAAANLGGPPDPHQSGRIARAAGDVVLVADATTVEIAAGETPFLDPARRTARGRTWKVEDFTPPWDFVLGRLATGGWAKLGPGLPHDLIPDGCAATWISDGGDLVEVQLRAGTGREAVLLGAPEAPPAGDPEPMHSGGSNPEAAGRVEPVRVRAADAAPEVRQLGDWIVEPDPAITRAGAAGTLAADLDLGAVAPGIAYLTGDTPTAHPGLTWFSIIERLPLREKVLKAWVRDHGIGTLEIKKRGIDLDPATLRKRLRPKGGQSATLLLTPVPGGSAALVVERLR